MTLPKFIELLEGTAKALSLTYWSLKKFMYNAGKSVLQEAHVGEEERLLLCKVSCGLMDL